ncbi:hypothetical protein [Paludisphaera rhizosphaerae]|uniref:hypothetical protein n=1 Tax=Paludisphaera rhizosphaerae TaxID=2711216 RepID=UPI0013EAC0BB|nr:hypothetical protein [Paludisphaera rhizosphaerae]
MAAIRQYRLKIDSMPTIIEMPHFKVRFNRFGLTLADIHVLELEIIAVPQLGKVVPKTNGLRKRRFVPPGTGHGKSGAYRVFYLSMTDLGFVFLWTIIDKHEQDNLSEADRNYFADQVARVRAALKQEKFRR